MKVLAVLLMIVALAIVIVPQFTNCEYGNDHPATINMQTSDAGAVVQYASMGSMDTTAAEASVPYRMMKCFWSARAEIIAGVPLFALGVFLLFARRKETVRVIGVVAALIGVLTILIPTTLRRHLRESRHGLQHADEAHPVHLRRHRRRSRYRRAGARRDQAPHGRPRGGRRSVRRHPL